MGNDQFHLLHLHHNGSALNDRMSGWVAAFICGLEEDLERPVGVRI